jgi:hypothetical protein
MKLIKSASWNVDIQTWILTSRRVRCRHDRCHKVQFSSPGEQPTINRDAPVRRNGSVGDDVTLDLSIFKEMGGRPDLPEHVVGIAKTALEGHLAVLRERER